MNIAILEVIADRIIELLHEHGPLDEAELLDELAADDMGLFAIQGVAGVGASVRG